LYAGVSFLQMAMFFNCGYALCAEAFVFVVVCVRRFGGRNVSSNRGDHLELSPKVDRSSDASVGFCCLSEFIAVACLSLIWGIGVAGTWLRCWRGQQSIGQVSYCSLVYYIMMYGCSKGSHTIFICAF